MVSALQRADDLFERASNASSGSGRRPHTSPLNATNYSERSGLFHSSEARFAHSGSSRQSTRRGQPRYSTPGPGAYNIDDSKTPTRDGGMGRHGKGGAAYSFGTASRYDDKAKQYLGAGHGAASAMFGHQSPGPATYNTRTSANRIGIVFGKDENRSMGKPPCSPGPVYSIGSNKHGAGATAPAFSVGSGHKPINNPNLSSPGPKYLPNNESYSGQKAASYTFRGGKLRGTEKVRTNSSPGPGAYDQKSFNGPGSGSAEWKFGTGTRPPLNANKDAATFPAPNAYLNTRSASRSGISAPVGGHESMNTSVQRGEGLTKASRFAEAKNLENQPGPGAYEAHKHLSMGVDEANMGSAHSMSANNSFGLDTLKGASPGPKYNIARPLGDSGPTLKFTKDARGRSVGGYGQSPGPVTAIPGELGDAGNTGAPSYSMSGGWGANPDKQFITKLHQSAQAVIQTPGGMLVHGEDARNKHAAPAYSWGFAERKGMDFDAPDSPGPAAHKMLDHHDQKHSSRHAKNYMGWEEGKMPGSIHTRERWENEDTIYQPSYMKSQGSKGPGPPIGLSHHESGRDQPTYTFSGADRFNID